MSLLTSAISFHEAPVSVRARVTCWLRATTQSSHSTFSIDYSGLVEMGARCLRESECSWMIQIPRTSHARFPSSRITNQQSATLFPLPEARSLMGATLKLSSALSVLFLRSHLPLHLTYIRVVSNYSHQASMTTAPTDAPLARLDLESDARIPYASSAASKTSDRRNTPGPSASTARAWRTIRLTLLH